MGGVLALCGACPCDPLYYRVCRFLSTGPAQRPCSLPRHAVALTFATLLVTILMFVLQWITSRPRRRIITIGILSSARLADRPETLAYLRALYGYEKCVNARISTVALNYRGDRDIRKASFEEDQPFRIEVGARVIDLLGASSEPEQASLPIVKAAGVALTVVSRSLRLAGSVARRDALVWRVAVEMGRSSGMTWVFLRIRVIPGASSWFSLPLLLPIVSWLRLPCWPQSPGPVMTCWNCSARCRMAGPVRAGIIRSRRCWRWPRQRWWRG